MILMSHASTEAALRALLRRVKRQPQIAPPQGNGGSVQAASGSAAHAFSSEEPPAPHAIAPVACTDPVAVHDVAALGEGTLSPTGIHRLAHHLAQCESCRVLVAAVVDDAQRAEWTGKHQELSRLSARQK